MGVGAADNRVVVLAVLVVSERKGAERVVHVFVVAQMRGTAASG